LTLYNENAAAARILSKDLQAQTLVALCKMDTVENKLRQKRQMLRCKEEAKSQTFQVNSVFADKLKAVPHIKDALNWKPNEAPAGRDQYMP
jgi:hypothetical protein